MKLNKTFKFVNYFLLSLGCSAPQYWATSLSIPFHSFICRVLFLHCFPSVKIVGVVRHS